MNPIVETAKPRLAAKARLKWDETRQKHLLLFPEGLLELNSTAYAILSLCNGTHTFADIVKNLNKQYKTNAIRQDVDELLTALADKGLVIVPGEP